MDIQLKQRLVGLTVIFSLAVIFLPMLLDGSGISTKPAPEQDFPPEPRIEAKVNVEELVIEMDKRTEKLVKLEPVIVDEISDPPGQQKNLPEKSEPKASEAKPGDKKMAEDLSKKPSASAKKEKDQVQPSAPAKKIETPKKAVAKDSSNSATKPAKKPKTTPDNKSGGVLWVVQTGSFQERDKAYKQRDRIRKSRLAPVFIEKYQHDGKLSYRVRMGPFLTRDKASVVRNKLRAKYNIRSILMKYEK